MSCETSLVRLPMALGVAVSSCWIDPLAVTCIEPASVGTSVVHYGPRQFVVVCGTPDEVHALLFPEKVGVFPSDSAEVERLRAWLRRIDGGDTPCTDESLLRQWAYEALTLGAEVPDDAR